MLGMSFTQFYSHLFGLILPFNPWSSGKLLMVNFIFKSTLTFVLMSKITKNNIHPLSTLIIFNLNQECRGAGEGAEKDLGQITSPSQGRHALLHT